MGGVCKEVSRETVYSGQTQVGTHRFGIVCVPPSFCPFPPPICCLALASLRYRCTVTAGDAEGVGSATQTLLPGQLDGFQVGDSSHYCPNKAMRDEQKGL